MPKKNSERQRVSGERKKNGGSWGMLKNSYDKSEEKGKGVCWFWAFSIISLKKER